jgi:hypothetical protein
MLLQNSYLPYPTKTHTWIFTFFCTTWAICERARETRSGEEGTVSWRRFRHTNTQRPAFARHFVSYWLESLLLEPLRKFKVFINGRWVRGMRCRVVCTLWCACSICTLYSVFQTYRGIDHASLDRWRIQKIEKCQDDKKTATQQTATSNRSLFSQKE